MTPIPFFGTNFKRNRQAPPCRAFKRLQPPTYGIAGAARWAGRLGAGDRARWQTTPILIRERIGLCAW